jgi:hypothetical protein
MVSNCKHLHLFLIVHHRQSVSHYVALYTKLDTWYYNWTLIIKSLICYKLVIIIGIVVNLYIDTDLLSE